MSDMDERVLLLFLEKGEKYFEEKMDEKKQ